MAFRESYRKQVELLLQCLPHIALEDDFALKGGTAINLFVRNFPRLSVDIDLTFLPVLPRTESIAACKCRHDAGCAASQAISQRRACK